MTAALRLARLVLSGHPDAHGLAARMVSEATAKARRVKARRAPRVRAERASREARREAIATTRAVVIARAGGMCEACCAEHGCHLHHLHGGGGNRRQFEGPSATVWLCVRCHHEAHRNDRTVLERLADLAQGLDAPALVQATLQRRIDKASR